MSTTRAKWYDLNEEFPNENEDVIVTNGNNYCIESEVIYDIDDKAKFDRVCTILGLKKEIK